MQARSTEEIMKRLAPPAGGRPAFLAPLAGYSDLPYRRICGREGAVLKTTELVSATGIRYSGLRKSWRYLAIEPAAEGPVMIQLFGAEASDFLYAAEAILRDPQLGQCTGIDINLGCPVPKVVRSGAGCALMERPAEAEAIVRALSPVLQAEGRLLGVKMRRGFAGETETAPQLAVRLAAAGAELITVHGRFREQYYSGLADWGVIRRVHEALEQAGLRRTTLLTANGDIGSAADFDACLAQTSADAGAIGRAAMGRPWLFRELQGREAPDEQEQAKIIREHAAAEAEFLGEATAMREFRKTLTAYAAGHPQAKRLRRACADISSLKDVAAWLEVFLYGEDEFFA